MYYINIFRRVDTNLFVDAGERQQRTSAYKQVRKARWKTFKYHEDMKKIDYTREDKQLLIQPTSPHC